MSFVSILARRFLTGKKRNTFISFISAVSLFGVALGVAALVVVMGVMEGFETELRSVITGTHSHIVVYSRRNVIPNRFEFAERLQAISPNIEAVSPFIFSEVMLVNRGRAAGSMVEGIDEKTAAQATNLERHLQHGIYPSSGMKDSAGKVLKVPTIVVGSALAERLGAKVGDEISMVAPFFEKDNLQPRVKRFQVAGVLTTGMYEYDSKYSLVTVDEAADFFHLPDISASAMKIKTRDMNTSIFLARKIKRELGTGYEVRDWSELNRNLLYAIKLQKVVIFIVLTSIIVVAAFNIVSTLVMMMSEKKREMSILKAMGMNGRQAAAIFIFVGFFIGLAGAASGVAVGVLLGEILAQTRFIHLPPDIYFISYLPVDIRLSTLLIVAGSALFVALLATLYPSYRVARESPVEGLRYE